MERALDPTERLHAPHLLDVEVAQVLCRLMQRKDLTVPRAEQALDNLIKLVIERHDHQSLVGGVWQLRDSISAYDVALAEALDAPLLTCDAKLAGAHGHRAKIELVRD